MNNDLLLKRIDELCTEKGVKKTTAFTESHVGKNFASNLKTSNPSQKNLALLAQYFDCTVDYLLGNSDDRETVTIPIQESIQESIQLSEEERILISAFRSASIEGRMRIIQVCMNEKDSKGETIIAG